MITLIAILAGCGTLIAIARMVSGLIKARMEDATGTGNDSLTRSELENLIRRVVREEQLELQEGIDHLEQLLENPHKLEARRTMLLDTSLDPDEALLEAKPARGKRELT